LGAGEVFGPKRDKATDEWSQLCNELYDLYASPNIRAIKKNEMCRACSTYGETGKVHIGFWWGGIRETHHFEDLGINGRI
jgi:hypothetical protein